MNNRTFDFILAIGSVVIGILLLTGNGGMFMGGGNAQKRSIQYDQKKMERASGIALILVGIATGIDSYTTGVAAKIAYTVVLLIIFIVLVVYFRTKCKKK
ncbi:MAG: DUF3784 domain-containing protein [Eubacteriales bacterium]|nr:DUF3784 domain-containing protein [Eubacteriales bacterium]